MARLLIEDVTLLYGDEITLHLRCRGGGRPRHSACADHSFPGRPGPPQPRSLPRWIVCWTITPTARSPTLLNERKLRPGRGQRFSSRIIARIQTCYSLRPRYDRYQACQAGMLTVTEMAQRLRVNPKTVKVWCAHGLLKGFRYTDKGESLYEQIDHPPRKQQGIKLQLRAASKAILPAPVQRGAVCRRKGCR